MFEFIVSYGVNKNRAMTLHSSSSNVKVSKLLVIYLEKFSFPTDVTLTSKVVLVADMRRALQRFSFETRPGPASASLFESARVDVGERGTTRYSGTPDWNVPNIFHAQSEP